MSFDTGPSQSITIPLIDRAGAHGTRTIQVKLTAPTGGAKLGASTATVSILDEMVGFRFDTATTRRARASASRTVTVRRTGPSQLAAQVTVSTVDPPAAGAGTAVPVADYTPASRSLNFLPGQISKTFTVPLKNDIVPDGNRTINLALSIRAGASSASRTRRPSRSATTISPGPSDSPAPTYTATEGASGNVVVNITVTRSGGAGGTVDVPWSITGGTATRGDDPPAAGVDVVLPASGVLHVRPERHEPDDSRPRS